MKKALTYRGAVMTWECDSNRHMNVMYYVNKFEHAGRNTDLYLGLTDIIGVNDVGIVVLEQTINYLREVFEDDLLYVESSLMAVGNKTFTVFHEMYNAKTKVKSATMRVVLVLFDKKNRKALPLPAETKNNLLKLLEA